MNVATLLRERAAQTPDRAAIVDYTRRTARTLSFAELESRASRAANAFRDAGLLPGSRVLVMHPMNADLYVALCGLLQAGLVPTVCDSGAGRKHVSACCSLVRPDAIFASAAGFAYAATIPVLAGVRRRFATFSFPGIVTIASPLRLESIVTRAPEDPAILTFTSGSTGTPKVVVRTHAILRAQLHAIRTMLPLAGVDVVTMPVVLLAHLASGVTSVIPGVDVRRPGKADAHHLARDIRRAGATGIVASPAMLERLLHVCEPAAFPHLRRIVMGGAPVMPPLMSALRQLAPHAEIVAVYGSTEAEPIAHVALSRISTRDLRAMRDGAGLLAGRPAAGCDVRIEGGEIVVAGEHVVPGYLDARGDEATKIHADGRIWHRTGDLGYFDPAGRLWLTGRAGAAIRDSRGALDPFAVECALAFENGVARSALAAVGERRVVVVEAIDGSPLDARALKQKLAWASIDEVRIERVPVDRRHNAKVDYPALAKRLGTA